MLVNVCKGRKDGSVRGDALKAFELCDSPK